MAGELIWTMFATLLTQRGQLPFRSAAMRFQSLRQRHCETRRHGHLAHSWPIPLPLPPPSSHDLVTSTLRFRSDTVGPYGKSDWL
jgi:hypothetical protein